MLTLRNKFDALQELSEKPTPNDESENGGRIHTKKQRAKPRVQWETLVVREKSVVVQLAYKKQQKEPNKYQCPET